MFDMKYFALTEEHIKLIRRFNITWGDGYEGAPCVDTKRPFGNSDLYADIAEILGIEPLEHDDMEDTTIYPVGTQDHLERVYEELETALQVVLEAGSFETGTYEREEYVGVWKYVPKDTTTAIV